MIVHNRRDGVLIKKKKEFFSIEAAIAYFKRHYLNMDDQNRYLKAGYKNVDAWVVILEERRLTNQYPQALFFGPNSTGIRVTMLRYRVQASGVGLYERMVNSLYGDDEYIAESFDNKVDAVACMEEIKNQQDYQGKVAMEHFSFRSRSRWEAVSALCELQQQLDQGREALEKHYMQWIIKGKQRQEDPELIGLSHAVDKLLEKRHRWLDYYGISRQEFSRLKRGMAEEIVDKPTNCG